MTPEPKLTDAENKWLKGLLFRLTFAGQSSDFISLNAALRRLDYLEHKVAEIRHDAPSDLLPPEWAKLLYDRTCAFLEAQQRYFTELKASHERLRFLQAEGLAMPDAQIDAHRNRCDAARNPHGS